LKEFRWIVWLSAFFVYLRMRRVAEGAGWFRVSRRRQPAGDVVYFY